MPLVLHSAVLLEHVRGQIRMRVVDPGVDDRDHDELSPGREVPGFRGIDIGVGETAGLTCVVECPLLDEARLVGYRVYADDVVRLRVLDLRPRAILFQCRIERDSRRQLHVPRPGTTLNALADIAIERGKAAWIARSACRI